MRMTKMSSFLIALMLLILPSLSAQATLMDMGDDTIYDTDTQLSWLSDAGMGGFMRWDDANAWADTLLFAGFDDWRLPTTLQPDLSCDLQDLVGVSYGYNCTGSEMGHLFYDELGGTATSSILTSGDPDLALFVDILPYPTRDAWSGTEYATKTDNAWVFIFHNGGQSGAGKDNDVDHYAWAVRSGERSLSAPEAVPEPATLFLLSSGGVGLIALRRRLSTVSGLRESCHGRIFLSLPACRSFVSVAMSTYESSRSHISAILLAARRCVSRNSSGSGW